MDVDDREGLAALADQLKAPMDAQAHRLRQHLKEAVIPAVQKIKQVHDIMEDEGTSLYMRIYRGGSLTLDCAVDVSFGKGIIVFDDACKRVEARALRDEDELKTAYHKMQVCLPFYLLLLCLMRGVDKAQYANTLRTAARGLYAPRQTLDRA